MKRILGERNIQKNLSGAIGRGENLGSGEFEDKAGADGEIVFDANAATVFRSLELGAHVAPEE